MSLASAMPDAIVDAHHHLWKLDQGRYPWLQDAYDSQTFILGEYRAICRDFGVAELRRSFGAAPVAATVHVEAERSRDEAMAETVWLHKQHGEHGLPSAVVAWVDLLAPDADEGLAGQAAWPLVRGVRFKPVTARRAGDSCSGSGSLHDPAWPQALERLARHGLCWDLRVPFWHLEQAAAVLADSPTIDVALEHAGLPWDRSEPGLAAWRKGMEALAANPRVHVKLSEFGLPGEAWDSEQNARLAAEVVAIFGWQRCMFGSNFPVASLRADYQELIRMTGRGLALAGLDSAQRRAVWHDNAVRFYRIEGVGA